MSQRSSDPGQVSLFADAPPAPAKAAITPPAAEGEQPPELALYQQLAAQAQELLRQGKRLDRGEQKALRELALARLAEHVWPDRAAAAQELGISLRQLDGLKGRGLPLPPHQPIVKAAVYRWLWRDSANSGGGRDVTDHRALKEEAEARFKQAKAAQLEGELDKRADDLVKRGLGLVLRPVRQWLLHTLPGRVWDLIQGKSRAEAEPLLRRHIEQSLRDLASSAGALDEDDNKEDE